MLQFTRGAALAPVQLQLPVNAAACAAPALGPAVSLAMPAMTSPESVSILMWMVLM